MDIVVKGISHDDLPQAAPLFAAYRTFYGLPYDIEIAADFLRERLIQADALILLALDASADAVGFTQVYPTFSSLSASRSWILNDLFVVESARCQGVGSRLVQEVLQQATLARSASVSLATHRDNLSAQRLYDRLGFKLDEEFLYFDKKI